MNPVDIKPLYTPAEVSRMLGRPQQTVSDWVKRGVLVTVMFGGRLFVPLAALQVHGMVWDSIRAAAEAKARLAR